MDIREYEKICNDSGMKAVKKENIGGVKVLVADGIKPACKDHKKPHYRTVWAVALTDDKLDVARPLIFTINDFKTSQGTIIVGEKARREMRIKTALEDAKEAISMMKNVGRYGG